MTVTNEPARNLAVAETKQITRRRKRSSTRAWVVVGLLVVFQIIAFADKAVLGLVAPHAMAELGLTPTQFGFIGSAFFFLYSIVSVMAGILASRFSVHWILLVMGVTWAVLQFPMLLGGGAAVLLITRIILGGAEGPATAMSLTSAHTWFHPTRRALPSNLVAIGSTMGPVLAAPFIAWVIGMWGWRWAFGALGLIGLAWVVAWILFGGDGPYAANKRSIALVDLPRVRAGDTSATERAADVTAAEETDGDTDPAAATGSATASLIDREQSAAVDKQKPVNIWRALFSVAFFAALLGGASNFWVQGFLTTWLPQYLGTVVGLSLPQVGVYTTFPWVLGAVVLLILGGIGHRLMQRGRNAHLAIAVPFGLSTAVAGAAFLLVPVATDTLSIVFLTIAGGCSLVFPMSAAAIGYSVGPKQRPIMMATLGGFAAIGAIISPSLVGSLMTSAGYQAPAAGADPTPAMAAAMADGVHSAFLVTGVFLITAGLLAAIFLRPERLGRYLQANHVQEDTTGKPPVTSAK